MPAPDRKPPGWSRLAWFATLYVMSLGAFTAFVYGLRALVAR